MTFSKISYTIVFMNYFLYTKIFDNLIFAKIFSIDFDQINF